MKPITLNDLEDCLDGELAWRKKELANLKLQLSIGNLLRIGKDTSIRCAIALAYAHWEGGFKRSAEHYLHFIAIRRLQISVLHPNISALCFKTLFDEIGNAKRHIFYADKVKEIVNNLDALSNIPWDVVIDTGSNLNHSRCVDILGMLAIDTKLFELRQKFIDESLLVCRNKIAHGEEFLPDLSDAQTSIASVITMLDQLKNEIIKAATTKSYRIK